MTNTSCEREAGESVNLGFDKIFSGDPGLQFHAFDADYLDRLRAGDARTEGHFVSYFSELIQLKLRSRLNSKEAIEDVKQETFARVLVSVRSPAGLRHAERLGAFVNTVCNNVLMEHYRSHSRTESIDEHEDSSFPSNKPDALSGLLSKDAQRIVTDILSKLAERDRKLLKLVFLEERDKDDVCRELAVDREYMRVLIHRAKKSFKSFYENKLGPGQSPWKG
jgi:RNA polymerase sigma-70 factor, ECF subfamily